jgi:hypothetical protein
VVVPDSFLKNSKVVSSLMLASPRAHCLQQVQVRIVVIVSVCLRRPVVSVILTIYDAQFCNKTGLASLNIFSDVVLTISYCNLPQTSDRERVEALLCQFRRNFGGSKSSCLP